ncbi:hypothetical protein AB0M43_34840 [Longispora sp. NPDC051575]|uniref:hypothetical protein n=1 Tax=Longispora sp. NPDC051575 TaxID=3154943 RepID=UPI00341F56E9
MNSFLDQSNRTRRNVIVAAVVLVLLVGAGLGWFLTRPGSTRDTVEPPTPTKQPSATPVQTPTGPMKRIKGERTVEGISVGYPHSTAGAVSAAAEYMAQIGSTLDPERAKTIARVVADPSFAGAVDYFAKGPVNTRTSLGLPAEGPLPAGASVVLGPAAYQLRNLAEDSAVVLLLGFHTASTPDGGVKPKVGVYPLEMHWDGSDWKILQPKIALQNDYSSLAAQPGTSEAAAKGWLELSP